MKKFIFVPLIFLLTCLPCRAQKGEYSYPETWMQYTPALFALAAPVVGIERRHEFAYRLLDVACTYAAQAAIVYPVKYLVREPRPDASANNSFPSGHSAAAFAGAELIRLEYGDTWGTVFYAGALYVAAMRVAHNRHWWWDTLGGAAVGVLSAHIGDWCTERLKLALSPSGFALCYIF